MAAIREPSQQETSSHSLVFRVMRLCRPALHSDLLLRTMVDDLWQGEEAAEETFLHSLAGPNKQGARGSDPATPPASSASAATTDEGSGSAATATNSMNSSSSAPTSTSGSSKSTPSGSVSAEDESFRARVELRSPLDALGLGGLLVLPQSFGSIHLGETFCSYISVGNHAAHDVSSVVIKAELQTERQRVVLADNSKHPLERIQAGGRHDFIIEHDIKELGAHTWGTHP